MRVVVITGSRRWDDRAAIGLALRGAELLIVGDCPTGADAIALEFARAWDIIPEVFVADWETARRNERPKSAGPMRNQVMVNRALAELRDGMDVVCHAFFLPGSVGTVDCHSRLRNAEFLVTVHGSLL